jgi:transposase-like protein
MTARTRTAATALPQVIAHAVRLYLRLALSFWDVEELLAERRVVTSYEAVRRWVSCRSCGFR